MVYDAQSNERVSCPFDHHSEDYARNYPAIQRALRTAAPVVWTESHGGYWVATTYEAIRRALRDAKTFSTSVSADRSKGGIHIPRPERARLRPVVVPSEVDGREHDDARLALNKHFSIKRIADLQPVIERHVRSVVSSVVTQGEFDIVLDLASPIVAGVVDEYLELGCADPPDFFRAMSAMVGSTPGNAAGDEAIQLFQDSWAFVVGVIERRVADPNGNDVICELARESNPAFSSETIQSMVFNILLGGADTTAQLTAHAMIAIDAAPNLREDLQAHPDRLPAFIDEVLRTADIVMGIARTVTCPVDFEGARLEAGDRIYLPLSAANHDPAKFADPYAFDMDRGAAGHLAMGAGSHFCLGANLARTLVRTILEHLLRDAPKWRILDGVEKNENKATQNTFRRSPAAFVTDHS